MPLLPVPITPIWTVLLGVPEKMEKGEMLGVKTPTDNAAELLLINFLLEFMKLCLT